MWFLLSSTVKNIKPMIIREYQRKGTIIGLLSIVSMVMPFQLSTTRVLANMSSPIHQVYPNKQEKQSVI